MSYRIICFTKILTLAIAPFLFILVVCEFAIVSGVYILLSPQRIQLCYGVYNETKRHFEIPIYF